MFGARSAQVSAALKINHAFISENSCLDWCVDRGIFSSILCIAIGGEKKNTGRRKLFYFIEYSRSYI